MPSIQIQYDEETKKKILKYQYELKLSNIRNAIVSIINNAPLDDMIQKHKPSEQ